MFKDTLVIGNEYLSKRYGMLIYVGITLRDDEILYKFKPKPDNMYIMEQGLDEFFYITKQ